MEWDDVEEDGGSPIYSFDVFIKENNTKWKKLNEEPVFTNAYHVDDVLTPGQLYEFKVEAFNEAGLRSNSDVSSKALVTPKAYGKFFKTYLFLFCFLDTPNMDGIELNVKLTALDAVNITWNSAQELKDNRDISYVIYYKSEGNAIWNEVHTAETSVMIEDLKEGINYVFKAAAENEFGMGNPTKETEPLKVAGNAFKGLVILFLFLLTT